MADNTEKPKAQTAKDIPWCKSLKSLPVFTRKEIDEHRNNSGKRKADDVSKPIKKTLKRGLKFQEERYLSSDTVYTKVFGNSFMVKAKCRASMSTRQNSRTRSFTRCNIWECTGSTLYLQSWQKWIL